MTEGLALYVRDGGGFVGTACTKGSWHDNGQSGGAVLALLGHVLEDVPTLTPMSLTRLTVDIVRPVPVGQRLLVESHVRREGKRIQVVDLVVATADAEHVVARALRLRDTDLASAAGAPASTSDENPSALLAPPQELEGVDHREGVADFLRYGAELRRTVTPVGGRHGAWIRLRVPVVAGEAVRPTSLATLPMDCVNLIGVNDLDPRRVSAINADVSAHLTRYPRGEWVALTGNTWYSHDVGHGMSAATLSDAHGVFGTASTSQLVQPAGH